MAVFGRYSFRPSGQWIGEQACASPVEAAPQLWVLEDPKGPRPPSDFEIDAAVVRHKFADISKRTTLAKFRFGAPDYDRWAIIYGRVEQRKGDDVKKAKANLLIRGSGVIVFVTPE